jgi:hypothetical protein
MQRISFCELVECFEKVKNDKVTVSSEGEIKVSPILFNGIDYCVFTNGTVGIGESDEEWYQFYFKKSDIKSIHMDTMIHENELAIKIQFATSTLFIGNEVEL